MAKSKKFISKESKKALTKAYSSKCSSSCISSWRVYNNVLSVYLVVSTWLAFSKDFLFTQHIVVDSSELTHDFENLEFYDFDFAIFNHLNVNFINFSHLMDVLL